MVSIKVTVSVEFLEEYCYISLVLNLAYITLVKFHQD